MKEIIVGTGTCGLSAGAGKVLQVFNEIVDELGYQLEQKSSETIRQAL